MHAVLEQILNLQRMDRILHELEIEIRGLPKLVAAAEKIAADAVRQREIAEANLEANRKEIQRLDYAVQDAKTKLAKLRKQIMEATTEGQLKAFQHEIEFVEGEIARMDAEELALLEATDELSALLETRRAEEQAAQERAQQETAAANAKNKEDRRKGAEIYKQRMALHASLPAEIRSEYDQLRKRHKDGQAAVECTDGLCAGCLMTIRPQLMQEIRTKQDRLFQCESCYRWLVYNPATFVA
jgi:predicted  nucleic acid-binding Zn-ribbon protein